MQLNCTTILNTIIMTEFWELSFREKQVMWDGDQLIPLS